jgi:hypothetical protein
MKVSVAAAVVVVLGVGVTPQGARALGSLIGRLALVTQSVSDVVAFFAIVSGVLGRGPQTTPDRRGDPIGAPQPVITLVPTAIVYGLPAGRHGGHR